MIFQDPYSSLNPRKTVGTIISDPFVIHGINQTKAERKQAVQALMDTVGLNPEHYNRYPHEFSGGQRQRIGVARALALKPKVIVADEPVSALDVSIQAQVLNLLRELQRDLGLTLIFIAHDLSVVRHMCDRVAVMYLGRIVELASSDQLYAHPRMPYTGALMSAVPVADPRLAKAKKRQVLMGDVPSPTNPPPGCRFHTRCWKAQEICRSDDPPLEAKDGREPGRLPLPADATPRCSSGCRRRATCATDVPIDCAPVREQLGRANAVRTVAVAASRAGRRIVRSTRSDAPIDQCEHDRTTHDRAYALESSTVAATVHSDARNAPTSTLSASSVRHAPPARVAQRGLAAGR